MNKRNIALVGLVAFAFYVMHSLRASRNVVLDNLVADSRPTPSRAPQPRDPYANLQALTVPVEGGASGLKPRFIYDRIDHNGKKLTVLSGYADPGARQGTVLTLDTVQFLKYAVEDPKAEAIAIYGGFNAVLTKDDAQKLLARLGAR